LIKILKQADGIISELMEFALKKDQIMYLLFIKISNFN